MKYALLAVAPQDEGVVKVIEQMKTSTVERDNKRAAIYVATVSPAMATTRYRRLWLKETLETPITGLAENENKDVGETELLADENGTAAIQDPSVQQPHEAPREDATEPKDGVAEAPVHTASRPGPVGNVTDTTEAANRDTGVDTGEGVHSISGGVRVVASDGAEAGEGGDLGGEERAVIRRKVTNERRQRRRASRRAARQRRQDRATAQRHVKGSQREKVDNKTAERRKVTVTAMQALVKRRKQRAIAPSVA
ncbi:hypothetical protein DVH05_027613 [Phytophthora capsici]|nr:hypothetical protein DVH05_027613 [Phytophthora capsici]